MWRYQNTDELYHYGVLRNEMAVIEKIILYQIIQKPKKITIIYQV